MIDQNFLTVNISQKILYKPILFWNSMFLWSLHAMDNGNDSWFWKYWLKTRQKFTPSHHVESYVVTIYLCNNTNGIATDGSMIRYVEDLYG